VLVVFIVMVAATKQELPVPALELLEDPTVPTVLFLIAAFGELLLLPGGLGLYFSLRWVAKSQMFLATSLWVVAVPMFLASRGFIIALSRISSVYMDTASETMRSAYLASAETSLETFNILAMMGLVLLSVASIFIGRVMLRSGFGRVLAYLAIAAGVLSVFSPFGVLMDFPKVLSFLGLMLGAVWQTIAGWKMFRSKAGSPGLEPGECRDDSDTLPESHTEGVCT
jgi:hypothetical protein